MAKRRHSLNPAKVKRDAEALAGPAAPTGAARRPRLRGRAGILLLGALTIVLLTFSFAPWDAWYLAYVALAPWVLAVHLAPTRRWALLGGWLSGLAFCGLSVYWLTWITLVGYSAGILYLSLYWLLAAALFRAAMRRGWPMWIVLPVVWVALEYARAYVPPAFPWFYLAHTQYRQVRLIQIADVTGQYGVSFFVAMVNGLVVDLAVALRSVRAGRRPRLRPLLVRGAVALGVAALLLGYGTWQLGRDTRAEGPVLGIVQRAFPISLGGRSASPEQILDDHLAGSGTFLGRSVDLVIWPETMLPRGLNREVLDLDPAALSGEALRALAARFAGPDAWQGQYTEPALRAYLGQVLEGGKLRDGREAVGLRQFAARVTHLARRLGCPVLAGGATVLPNDEPLFPDDRWLVGNGAIWFDANDGPGRTYAKRHLVPFSEYVPFKRGWTGLHRLLRTFVPEAMEQLEPGKEWTRFDLVRPHGRWRLVSPICYEGTFARVCRHMVYEGGRKKADLIANLSNDGWFVYRRGGGPYRGSTEQAQHLGHYCFRAVENRVPVVRAVNTGISASIDANGRIVAEVRHGSKRTMVPGTLTLDGARRNEVEFLLGHGPRVLVDRRTSWYSRVGDVFAAAVGLAAAAMAVWLVRKRPGKKEGAKN